MNDLKGKVAVVTGASKGGCAAPRWPAKARTCAFRKSYPDVMVVQPGKDLPQVRLAEDQQPVQATRGARCQSDAPHTDFATAIPARSAVADTHGPHPGRKDMSVGTVIVAHQVARR